MRRCSKPRPAQKVLCKLIIICHMTIIYDSYDLVSSVTVVSVGKGWMLRQFFSVLIHARKATKQNETKQWNRQTTTSTAPFVGTKQHCACCDLMPWILSCDLNLYWAISPSGLVHPVKEPGFDFSFDDKGYSKARQC